MRHLPRQRVRPQQDGEDDLDLTPEHVRHCRGWALVAARERVTDIESVAAAGHLELCRGCRGRLRDREEARKRLLAQATAVTGTGLAGGGTALSGALAGKVAAALIGAATLAVAGTSSAIAATRGGQHVMHPPAIGQQHSTGTSPTGSGQSADGSQPPADGSNPGVAPAPSPQPSGTTPSTPGPSPSGAGDRPPSLPGVGPLVDQLPTGLPSVPLPSGVPTVLPSLVPTALPTALPTPLPSLPVHLPTLGPLPRVGG